MFGIKAPQIFEGGKLIPTGDLEFGIFDLDPRLFLPCTVIEWEILPQRTDALSVERALRLWVYILLQDEKMMPG